MRTRLSICARKKRFASMDEALSIARVAAYPLRPYRCDRCDRYHLTGRTKGKLALRAGAGRAPLA